MYNIKGDKMNRFSRYTKVALVLVFSLILTTIVQSGALNNSVPVNTDSLSTHEKVAEKTAKKVDEKSTEKSTEQSTKKVSEKKEKTTEKPTEKTTQKKKEETTEKPTVAAEEPTEAITEELLLQVSNGETDATEDATYVNPTDPPTEWSQELQDLYNEQYNAGYLIAIDEPDYGYATGQVTLSDEDRKLACQIVFGEAGGEGFEGCCLVAQCLKDSMIFLGYNSIKDVQKYCKYDGWKEEYSQEAEAAVNYIFDQNRSAIAHRVLFFYATDLCTSKWHETQNHILTYHNSRFFDMAEE